MKKISLILIILLVLSMTITACQSKVPDGVSKEFYNEIKGILSDLVKEVQDSKNGEINIYEHSGYKKLLEMNDTEQYVGNEMYILDYTILLCDFLGLYYIGMTHFKDDIYETSDKICELMNIKFDATRLIK